MPKLKPEVNEKTAGRELWYAVGVVDGLVYALTGELRRAIVTSMNDGRHGTNSRHYRDLAVDLRSKHLDSEQKAKVFRMAKEILDNQGYDLLLEALGTSNEHFHVEHDPKGDEKFIEREP